MRRILVVDDEAGVREFVAEALQADGFLTVPVASGEAALEELSKHSYALLLTDLKMPGMGGLALLTRAKELQPELEVIVLTAQGSVDIAVEAMRLGAFDFIQKPVSGPQELRLLAERALERRSLLDIRENVAREAGEPSLSYGDPQMDSAVEALRKVAKTQATVLLVGESGTGTEVAAKSVHRWSPRATGPFVAINCAALSENLLESELFGHEKGAFTGAVATKRGRIELAAGGTFFLDEVGELKPDLQAKLLRVLQEKKREHRVVQVVARHIPKACAQIMQRYPRLPRALRELQASLFNAFGERRPSWERFAGRSRGALPVLFRWLGFSRRLLFRFRGFDLRCLDLRCLGLRCLGLFLRPTFFGLGLFLGCGLRR